MAIQYFCSDGTRVSQQGIMVRYKKSREKKYAGFPTQPCEGCGSSEVNGSAHIIAQARCKVIHKTELIWDPRNYYPACRVCNGAIENPKGVEGWLKLRNIEYCLQYIQTHDLELYVKFSSSAEVFCSEYDHLDMPPPEVIQLKELFDLQKVNSNIVSHYPVTKMENNTPTTEVQVIKQKTLAELEQDFETQFQPIKTVLDEWLLKAENLKVTDASQVELMQESAIALKAITSIETQTKSLHDELKEESLRRGQIIDKIQRNILAKTGVLKEQLKQNKDFIIIQEQNKKKELAKTRYEELSQFMGVEAAKIQLGELDEEVYQNILKGAKEKQESAKKKNEEDAAEKLRLQQEVDSLKTQVQQTTQQNEELKTAIVSNDPFKAKAIVSSGTSKPIDDMSDKQMLKNWATMIKNIKAPELKAKGAYSKLIGGVATLLTKTHDYIIKNL